MDIQTLLKSLNCSNTEKTSLRFLNDYNFYIRCVKPSFDDATWTLLGTELENKHTKGAFEKAHLLKGVAGNAGLTVLYDMLCKMVESLRSENPDYENLLLCYAKVIQMRDDIKKKI